LAYIDIDEIVRQTHGYAKHGAGRGYTGVKGLNALIAIVSTPLITETSARRGRGAGAARGLGVLRPRGDRHLGPAQDLLEDRPPGCVGYGYIYGD
jgi:hypothetical protein